MRRRKADRIASGLAALAAACALGIACAAEEADRAEQPGRPGATNSISPSEAMGAPAAAEPGMRELRLGEAVLMALANNRALKVQRLNPKIQKTYEGQARALFDPSLSGEVLGEETHTVSSYSSTGSVETVATRRLSGGLGVAGSLPSGTRLDLALNVAEQDAEGDEPLYAATVELGATQALLQGRPIAANLARLRQARLDTEMSVHELQGFAAALVAETEAAYWDCCLALRQEQIFQESLSLAEKQLKEVEHRIRVGSLSETELAAAQAEIALRREAQINARGALATARLRLFRLVDPDALRGPRELLALTTEPAVPEPDPDPVESHVALAMKMRPDLNQARLRVQRGDLDLLQTRNGLLPKLDLFIRLGQTGYAATFGDSVSDIGGHGLAFSAGIEMEYPLGNRDAGSRHQRALLTQEQTGEALENIAALARVDVEAGCIEVERTREQVAATATTRKFQEEKLRAETAKFDVGRSTSLLVAQAQRDLVGSQAAAVQAVVNHLKALVTLFRLEGSLLDRRGLSVSEP